MGLLFGVDRRRNVHILRDDSAILVTLKMVEVAKQVFSVTAIESYGQALTLQYDLWRRGPDQIVERLCQRMI